MFLTKFLSYRNLETIKNLIKQDLHFILYLGCSKMNAKTFIVYTFTGGKKSLSSYPNSHFALFLWKSSWIFSVITFSRCSVLFPDNRKHRRMKEYLLEEYMKKFGSIHKSGPNKGKFWSYFNYVKIHLSSWLKWWIIKKSLYFF